MFTNVRSRKRPTIVRARYLLLTLIAALTLGVMITPTASATTHEYCYWGGGNCTNPAWVAGFSSGLLVITLNSATLVYHPTLPTIYCGAHDGNGNDYGSYAPGNPTCYHSYGAGNMLKAVEYTDIAATTHGTIWY